MNDNERFEFIAAAFYEETKMMAPGKSPSPAAYGESDEERMAAWDKWMAAHRATAKAFVRVVDKMQKESDEQLQELRQENERLHEMWRDKENLAARLQMENERLQGELEAAITKGNENARLFIEQCHKHSDTAQTLGSKVEVLQADLSAHALALKAAHDLNEEAVRLWAECVEILPHGSPAWKVAQNRRPTALATPLPVYASAQGTWEKEARELMENAVDWACYCVIGKVKRCHVCEFRAFLAQPASAFVERASKAVKIQEAAAVLLDAMRNDSEKTPGRPRTTPEQLESAYQRLGEAMGVFGQAAKSTRAEG